MLNSAISGGKEVFEITAIIEVDSGDSRGVFYIATLKGAINV